jgi:hypothetical protein
MGLLLRGGSWMGVLVLGCDIGRGAVCCWCFLIVNSA